MKRCAGLGTECAGLVGACEQVACFCEGPIVPRSLDPCSCCGLSRYAADTGSFESQETLSDKKGKIVRQGTSQVSFRKLCEDAIAAIEKRTGKKAPAR